MIDQIPEAGAWDGVHARTEPELSADGIYQITSGSELAWFAHAVNTSGGRQRALRRCSATIFLWDFITGRRSEASSAFSGSFDGGGLYGTEDFLSDLADTYAGLFGKVEGGGGHEDTEPDREQEPSRWMGRSTYAGGIAAYVSGAGFRTTAM